MIEEVYHIDTIASDSVMRKMGEETIMAKYEENIGSAIDRPQSRADTTHPGHVTGGIQLQRRGLAMIAKHFGIRSSSPQAVITVRNCRSVDAELQND
jgi:hypothetical protein